MSLYGRGGGCLPKYTAGAIANAMLVPQVYPGWSLWVYVAHDIDRGVCRQLTDLGATVVDMPPRDGHLGMFWRFYAAAPTVLDSPQGAVIFRDADSRLNVREAAAVEAWLRAGTMAHAMHDHIHHRIFPIHGGMWGVRGWVLPDIAKMVYEWETRTSDPEKIRTRWGDDQHFLRSVVWPRVRDSLTRHARADLLTLPEWRWGGEPFPEHPPYAGFVGEIIEVEP